MKDLTSIYKNYKGKWVALDKSLKKVVASDDNAVAANEKAIKKGVKIPTLFKVPEKNIPYVGYNNEI